MDAASPGPLPDASADADKRADQADTSGRAGTPTKPQSLWRSRDYTFLWLGGGISALGTSVADIAYPLLVLFVTGSVARAGIITAAELIGGLCTTLWGGALADRLSRKALLITAPLVQSAALAAVAVVVHGGRAPLILLMVAAAVSGLAGGIGSGAQTPALRRIVPAGQLASASSQFQGRGVAADLIGAPLGGFLFSVARWLPFGADAGSFLFAAAGVGLIRRPLGPDRAQQGTPPSMLADIRAGIRFMAAVPLLRFAALWAPVMNMLATGYFLLFIATLKYRGADPTVIGYGSSVAMAGGIVGAIIGPAFLRRVRAKLVLHSATWTLAATMLLTGVLPEWWEVPLPVFGVLLLIVPLNAAMQAYVVRLVPDELSGRVGAALSFGAGALAWLGPLLAGGLASAFDPPVATLLLGAAVVPLAVIAHITPSVRLLDTPIDEVAAYTN